MHKKVAIILAIISIFILVAGISSGNEIREQLKGESEITDQTTPNMIQGLKGVFARKPLISRGI